MKAEACQGHSERGELKPGSFPGDSVRRGVVKRSRMGRRRAIVLIAVHVAIFLHILHWQLAGETMAPLEPSEAMYTVAYGTMNAGLILLGLSLLATMILGRFFCGWACHLVALQDLSAWLLRKVGIRPRPLRSRWLVLVPLGAGLHMFFWPQIARWIEGQPDPELHAEFTKTDFWETFPGFWIGAATFVFCGFLMIYLLGAKGFCTYACPYGGLFGVLDRLAPGRIRVTDACKRCGHCSAVCTSNVLVHKEVHEHGMVVDPGCMKCMDCVSACPEKALRFGFGAPALGAKPRRAIKKLRPSFSWREELAMVGIFAVTMVILRGLPDQVPLWTRDLYNITPSLLALGIATTMAFVGIYAWRLLRRDEVRLQGWTLKRGGKWSRSGKIFAGATAAALAFFLHSGAIQAARFSGMSAVDETESLAAAARRFDRDALERIDPKTEAALARMESRLGFVERFGLVHDPLVVHQLAWAAQCRGDLEGAIVRLREAVHRDPAAPINHSELGHLLTLRGDFGAAVDRFLSAQARSEPDGPLAAALAEGLRRTIRLGLQTSGIGLAEVVLDRTPADGEALHLAGEILAATGQGDRVLAALTPDRLPEALRADPPVGLLLLRGKLLAQRRRHAEARECFGAAHERQPERFEVHLSLAEQLYLEGQRGKARAEVEELRSAHPNRPEPLLFLAQLEREAGRPAQARQLQREAAELRQHGTSR